MALILADLLKENYYELKDQQCIDRVVNFVIEVETIKFYDIDFIKDMTKVSSLILKDHPKLLDDFKERIFNYHLEGIEVCKDAPDELRYDKIITHLHTHAGLIAKLKYDETGDIEWLIKNHELNLDGGDLAFKHDHVHAANSYRFSAYSAHSLYYRTKDLKWMKKAYELVMRSGDIGNGDLKYKATMYSNAADYAEIIFKEINDISWGKLWFDSCLQGAKYFKFIEMYQSQSHMLRIASVVSKKLFKITEDEKWDLNHTNYKQQSRDIYDRIDNCG
ncbi:hypothetical protein ACFL1H_02095 [Nanoarchaeota archaeon]